MSSASPWNKLQNVFLYREICHFSSPRKEVNKIFIYNCNIEMFARHPDWGIRDLEPNDTNAYFNV